ncbi:MAG: cytochrome bc complex cytochrome b subunit [Anaerolineae bacterium]|jgi:quinol-cytochrome oxidoreductase complex cytochrome b subunit
MAEKNKEKQEQPVQERFRAWADQYLTSVFAELPPEEIRRIFRGEEPGRPNPRYKPHNVSFWFHMKPRWYWKSVTNFFYTFGLGWGSVFLAVVLGITGFLLMVFYRPSTDSAYFDMLNLLSNVPFGKLIRDIHRLGAELMVAVVMLHMLRVFFTASYKQPRSFNWTVGVTLLLVTWLFSYSGYLLPWDQLAYWAVTIGASMIESVPVLGEQLQLLALGGPEVGQLGLLRFYTLHILILPIALIIIFGVHFHKVVRQQISRPPAVEAGDKEDTERVGFLPEVFSRELMWVAVGLLIILVAVTTVFSAPLEDHADPFVTPLHATAPWYFLWIQGLIKLPDVFGGIVEGKFIYGVLLPGAVIGFLYLLPYIDRNPSRRWQDRKFAVGAGIVAVILWSVLTYMGSPNYKVQAPPEQEVALEFLPTDREGHIHEIPWEELIPGSWDTETYDEGTMQVSEHLDEFMADLQRVMEKEQGDLPGGVATITIQIWQRNLKRVDLDIVWQGGGKEQTFNQYTYIHKATAP